MQRLRYKVLAESVGLSALANPEGFDDDALDAWCDHLIVRESRSLSVVGAFRVLSPRAAACSGRFPAEQGFDLERLQHLRGRMAEAGSACVHPDYRGSGVLMMLWAGLLALLKREGCDYLASRTSVSLADGGYNATALYQRLSETPSVSARIPGRAAQRLRASQVRAWQRALRSTAARRLSARRRMDLR